MAALGLRKVFAFYSLITAISALAIWKLDHGDWLLPDGPRAWALAVGSGLGVGLLTVGVSRIAVRHFEWAERLSDEFKGLIGPLDWKRALAVALLSGIAEEALFRGVLQPAIGLWLAAAIFGVLHIGPTARFLPWTVMAFVAGVVFGLLFSWTGTLLAPVLAHVSVNFLNLRYLGASSAQNDLHLEPMGGEHFAGH